MRTHCHLLNLLAGFYLLLIPSVSQSLYTQTSSILIAGVRFEGNKSIPADQLRLLLRRSQEGSRYVPGNLVADLRRVEKAYQDEGFLHAKVGPADIRMQVLGKEKAAVVVIPVIEGARYKVQSIAVKNAKALSPATLMQMCPLKEGAPYSRVKISQWQEMIENAYREMGYIRIRCRANEFLNEISKTVDCTLECAEGRAYSIGKITLVGDESIDRSRFKRQLLFSEGGIFNPDMVAMSIQYLNRMGLYKPISNSDVEFDIDDEKGTVDLTLHIFLALK